MNYTGVIIEESLENTAILRKVKVTETKVEPITPEHKTPWLKQWTLHTVEIPMEDGEKIAQEIARSLDTKHTSWCADAKMHGISLGIPEYQVDFAPKITH